MGNQMEECRAIDPAGCAAFAALWKHELTDRDDVDGRDGYRKYTLDVSGHPELDQYSQQLNGLQVLEIDDYAFGWEDDLAQLTKPGTVDIVLYTYYGSLRPRHFFPEGTRYVAILDGDMTSTPALPDSVEMIILQNCHAYMVVDRLPSQLQSLLIAHYQGLLFKNEIDEITIDLPVGLRSLCLMAVEKFYLRGPMPHCLEVAYFNKAGDARADEPLPPSLRRVDFKGMTNFTNQLELSCSPHLTSLTTKASEFHLMGYPVTTLEEYNAVCRASIGKKSARSARR